MNIINTKETKVVMINISSVIFHANIEDDFLLLHPNTPQTPYFMISLLIFPSFSFTTKNKLMNDVQRKRAK